MARLNTLSFESNDATIEGITLSAATFDTAHARTGARALKCDSGGTQTADVLVTSVASRTYHIRFAIYSDALSAASNLVFVNSGATQRLRFRLANTSGGTQVLDVSNNVLVTGPSIAAGQFYVVEIQMVMDGSNQISAGELWVDGVSYGRWSGTTLASFDRLRFANSGGSQNVWYDDVAINDDTGSTRQTGRCGLGKSDILFPTSDNAVGTGWTGGGGGTTGIFTGVDNTPPTGAADPGTDASQIRNASSASADYDANLESYSTAGAPAGSVIVLVQSLIVTAAPVSTGAKTGQVVVVSNPAGNTDAFAAGGGSAGQFWNGAAAGAYPTGWKLTRGTITYNPTGITLGTSPVLRCDITGGTSTRIADVCFMGLLVEYVPGSLIADTRRVRQNHLLRR